MKYEQVVVDYWTMAKTSCTCLLLALSGYVLLKMVQTIFWLPGYLQKNQKRLEELAAQYSVDLNEDVDVEEELKTTKKEEKSELIVNEDNPNADANADTKATDIVEEKKKVK